MEENIDGLNLGQDDLQRMLDALRNEYESNMTALEDKLASLQELALNSVMEPPAPKSPEPRSPSPPVKLPPIPGASPAPDNSSGKLSDLENALNKKDSEMRSMQQKMKWLMQDTNKQISDLKDKLKNLDKELLNLAKAKKLPSPVHKTSDMVSALTRLSLQLLLAWAQPGHCSCELSMHCLFTALWLICIKSHFIPHCIISPQEFQSHFH